MKKLQVKSMFAAIVLTLAAAAMILNTTGDYKVVQAGTRSRVSMALQSPVSGNSLSTRKHVAENYAKLPLSFEPVAGGVQHETANFLSHGKDYTLKIANDGAVLSLRRPPSKQTENAAPAGPRSKRGRGQNSATALLEMKLLAANPASAVTATDELPGKTNYLIGNDPKKWRTNVPNYAKVECRSVYPGIDLVYYGNQRELEYDFVVAPGAAPDAIRLDFQTHRAESATPNPLRIAENGDLVAQIEGGEVRMHKPVAYQLDDAKQKRYITANYALGPSGVSFAVGAYDRSRPLVIDPVVGYSTYLGGSLNENDESGGAIAVDLQGNAYVTADTDSSDFPTKNPYQPAHAPDDDSDAYIAKISADGSSLIYSTYLGGTGGDEGLGIAVDLLGHAYVSGSTTSADFPVTPGAFQTTYKGKGPNLDGDGFVVKLSPNGSSLLYSTYLGGSSDDVAFSIKVDLGGFAYVAGWTASPDFPVTPGAVQTKFAGSGPLAAGDAFVTKLNATGTKLVYSTYLGGSNDDYAAGIAIDGLGNAYVAGVSASVDFPVTPGAYQTTFVPIYDGLVAKLNATGSKLIYSTYLSGSPANDACNGLALDAFGNVYVSGDTLSANFPVSPEAFQKVYHGTGPLGYGDGFVTKLNAAGSKLLYSTYLGGSGDDLPLGIVVDFLGRAYVTGITNSTDYPVTPGAFQTVFGGSGPNQRGDALLTVLNTEASALLYSTYLGGSGDDPGFGIARDLAGNIYITGSTNSPNFYVTPNALQTIYGGAGSAPEMTGDAFVTKFNKDLF